MGIESEDAVSRVGIITEGGVRGWDSGLLWTAGLWEEGPVLCGVRREKGHRVWGLV